MHSSFCRKHVSLYDQCWQEQDEAFQQARKDKSAPPAPELKQAELEPRGPALRAGYFEADIKARSVYPVYWPGEPSTLIRGTWFVVSSTQGRNLIPLPHPFACKLEQAWQTRYVQYLYLATVHRCAHSPLLFCSWEHALRG